MGFPNDSVVKNLPANAGDTGDVSLILGWGRATGKGNDNTLQYSCLGNSMERGAWGYSPWGCRVGHDLATKQPQQACCGTFRI